MEGLARGKRNSVTIDESTTTPSKEKMSGEGMPPVPKTSRTQKAVPPKQRKSREADREKEGR